MKLLRRDRDTGWPTVPAPEPDGLSLGDQPGMQQAMRNRLAAKDARIAELQQHIAEQAGDITGLYVAVEARERSITDLRTQLDAARRETERSAHLALARKETIGHLTDAAVQRQACHAAEMADQARRHEGEVARLHQIIADLSEAGRLPGDDREPTEPLPILAPDGVWHGGQVHPLIRQMYPYLLGVQTTETTAPAPTQDDLYMPGWQGRSSAQTSAPRVGE